MKVAIAGGHGKIALRLERILSERGDEPVGLIRKPEQADDLRERGAEAAVVDLEHASVDDVASAIGGADAVVFAAGAGPGSGEARKETMDHGGAVKLIAACRAQGVSRYVMVSSMGADPNAEGGGFNAYQRAKGKADRELVESGLEYTIVRPGGLTDDPGTGKVHAAASVERGEIPRDDVAAVLAAVLARPETAGLIFEVVSGDDPIEDAIAALVA